MSSQIKTEFANFLIDRFGKRLRMTNKILILENFQEALTVIH